MSRAEKISSKAVGCVCRVRLKNKTRIHGTVTSCKPDHVNQDDQVVFKMEMVCGSANVVRTFLTTRIPQTTKTIPVVTGQEIT